VAEPATRRSRWSGLLRGTGVLAVLGLLGASRPSCAVPLPSDVDLLPELADGDVCASEQRCWPRETSLALHRSDAGEGRAVRLPTGSWSSVYVGVDDGTVALDLEYLAVGTELVVQAKSDGDTEVVLARGATTGEQWDHLALDLSAWRGRAVHLRLRPEPVSDAADRRCAVRRLELKRGDARPRATFRTRTPKSADPPNVVLYVIDTLRADRLGCYGYARPTSPRIDAFARSAVVFRDAVAQSSWTLPATASLLTGRTPPHHGAIDVGTALLPNVVTLPERLRARGYRTAAFVTNSLASRSYGLDRGFAEFHLYPERPGQRATTYLPARILQHRVRRWLQRNATREPFFLYVHATDPHWPYLPAPRHARPFRQPGRTRADERSAVRAGRSYFFGNEHHGERPTTMPRDRVAVLSDLYDGDVRAADEAFGVLMDDLAGLDLLDRTLVVLTSDHGEEFLDHDGLGHGQTLHDEVLHVPLAVRLPGGTGGGERVQATVQQIDVVPTILALAGVAPGAELEGRSLLDEADADARVVSHLDQLGVRFDSITTRHWKAIRDLGAHVGPAPIAVYDRDADRIERHDVASVRPVIAGYGRQLLRRALMTFRPGPEVDDAVLARLRALGYVDQ